MSVQTKFQPIERDVLYNLGGLLDPAEQSAALAAYAASEIEEATRQNEQALGHAVAHETIVDGRKGAPLASVRPDGVIVANFDLGSDVVQYIWDEVKKHAPALTGAFRDSIRLYADGNEVGGPEEAGDADEIVITSVAPYARKLEGAAGKKHMSSLAPDGVFEAVAAMAAARYGNQAKIKFSFRSPMGGATELEQWAQGHSSRAEGEAKRRRQYQKDVRQPAIFIWFK